MFPFITLPQFLNTSIGVDVILPQRGLTEAGGKLIGFVTAPVTLNITDTGKDLFLASDAQFNWNLMKVGEPRVSDQYIGVEPKTYATDASTEFKIDFIELVDKIQTSPKYEQGGTQSVELRDLAGTYTATLLIINAGVAKEYTITFDILREMVDADGVDINETDATPVIQPFRARIERISGNKIFLNQTWNGFKEKIVYLSELKNERQTFGQWTIQYKHQEKRDLNIYIHFGGDDVFLATNYVSDNETFQESPYSVIYKLYDPLPEEIEEKDQAFVVREMIPELTEVVELVPYEQEDEGSLVLRKPNVKPSDSPITNRPTEYSSHTDLVTTDTKLSKKIEDEFISGSGAAVELNIEYSNYENFVNFSSAEKRLKNFKYKIQQIESNTQESASLLGTTSAENDLLILDRRIRESVNKFDGYEKYLYHESSSYASSSFGEFPDASWPTSGSTAGTYDSPYRPVSSSNTQFTDWYGSVVKKTGQLYSASLYDRNNPNRLVNLLPEHVRDDANNSEFLDFLDMIGHQFDELWVYTKALSDITDRQSDLSKGFSKELIYNIAKSLGWDIQDGKDLIDLPRSAFGQKLSGTTYSLYTSGSADKPAEREISREITKRLIQSMPYLLKTKGTINSLKGIISCYGLPSSILRVREYGGMSNAKQRLPFEITRKWTRALGFSGSQYISGSWTNDSLSGRKADTVEFRFKSATGSNQLLVNKDKRWGIRLKDNGSVDNYGTVSFMLSGSGGYREISSSLLPIYDGEFWSVMLRKQLTDNQLLPSRGVGDFGYETGSFLNSISPPFFAGANAQYGELIITSGSVGNNYGSGSIRREGGGQYGLKLINNRNKENLDRRTYTHLYKRDDLYPTYEASVASVSAGDTVLFSGYAKASSSNELGGALASLKVYELDSNENIVNWDEESPGLSLETDEADGGSRASERVAVDTTEWKLVQVKKQIKFPNTSKLSIQLINDSPGETIFFDDLFLKKVQPTGSDAQNKNYSYELFVKQYDAGIDRIRYSSKSDLFITGSNAVSQSHNVSWTGSGTFYVGGVTSATSSFGSSMFSGSMMEFRLWNSPLNEEAFDNHVTAPKSFVGNHVSASYTDLFLRYSFDDNSTLTDGTTIRDVSSDQTTTNAGVAAGFAGGNLFHSVVDRTKTFVPNYGPNRRMSDKIRIENNFLSGSGVSLNRVRRSDYSSNDFSPVDSPKLGIYFSPTDVINEDIVFSFANLDFNQYLGDPRDRFEYEYRGLAGVADKYWKKYRGGNNFWAYMRLIKYYDQSIFKQLNHLVPARAKTYYGTLIEPNIFERSKDPVQRERPTFTTPFYEKSINLSQIESTVSGSPVLTIETEFPYYTSSINYVNEHLALPSLYKFSGSDSRAVSDDVTNDDINLYISASAEYGGPDSVFQDPFAIQITGSRKSRFNLKYKFHYTSSLDWADSNIHSIDLDENKYTSKSLEETDIDTKYEQFTGLRRSFYEGVEHSRATTLDNDFPVIVRISAPTVAVPTTVGISDIDVTVNPFD